MKTNKIRSYWIASRSIFATLKSSLHIMWCTFFSKKCREKITCIAHSWSKKLLRIAKINYKVLNPYNFSFEPNKSYILMSNHSSSYDIPLIFTALAGDIRMMAKQELFRVPIWGRAMRAGEFISIDRQNARQAIKDLKLAREKLESGIILWIAPEGTRSKDGKLLPFKKGGFMLAKKTSAIIVPIGIRGSNKVLPAKTMRFNLNQKVEVHIEKPIDSTKYSQDELLEKTRKSIAKVIED